MTMGGLFDRVKPSDAGRGCKIENRAPAAGRARPALCGIKRQDVEVGTIAGRQGGSGGCERCHRFYGMSACDIKPMLDPKGGGCLAAWRIEDSAGACVPHRWRLQHASTFRQLGKISTCNATPKCARTCVRGGVRKRRVGREVPAV